MDRNPEGHGKDVDAIAFSWESGNLDNSITGPVCPTTEEKPSWTSKLLSNQELLCKKVGGASMRHAECVRVRKSMAACVYV